MALVTARTTIPDGPWTVDDLDDFPEGTGRRYELVDGALLVSAEASLQHQRVAAALFAALSAQLPPELEAFWPIDVRLSPTRQIAPDITVARRSDATGQRLAGIPVLTVEVASPSTRAVDQVLKRHVLEEAGVAGYWLVDPDDVVVTALALGPAGYVEVGRFDDVLELDAPFPVRIDLRALLRR